MHMHTRESALHKSRTQVKESSERATTDVYSKCQGCNHVRARKRERQTDREREREEDDRRKTEEADEEKENDRETMTAASYTVELLFCHACLSAATFAYMCMHRAK